VVWREEGMLASPSLEENPASRRGGGGVEGGGDACVALDCHYLLLASRRGGGGVEGGGDACVALVGGKS